MSDIYHIPNDDGKYYRLNKFVEYQHEVPSIHYRFLGEYIKNHKFDKDTTINFCFLMCVTYNELTCILLHEMFKEMTEEEIWDKYKTFLSFGSARKYAKNNDQFIDLIKDEFDKTKKVTPLEIKYLSTKLSVIQKSIQETYPEQDSEISMFIGKICSFRNLFKNARYGGFHHDRQLGVLKQYEVDFPQYSYLWEECYKLRQDIFPSRFLGELHGWDGIRKERKKIWLTTGKTGVEDE